MDPITILAALGPVAVDLVKALVGKILPTQDFKPATLTDWIKMQELELERFKAMQDTGGDSGWPWVNAVIRLQKPAYASLALLVWAYQESFVAGGASDNVVVFAQAIGFWLFGSTTLFAGKKAKGAITTPKTEY